MGLPIDWHRGFKENWAGSDAFWNAQGMKDSNDANLFKSSTRDGKRSSAKSSK